MGLLMICVIGWVEDDGAPPLSYQLYIKGLVEMTRTKIGVKDWKMGLRSVKGEGE